MGVVSDIIRQRKGRRKAAQRAGSAGPQHAGQAAPAHLSQNRPRLSGKSALPSEIFINRRAGSAKWRHCLSPTCLEVTIVLGGNAFPIQKIDLLEGPTRFVEEQHEAQAISQIVFAGEIYPWFGHGRYAHAAYKAKARDSAGQDQVLH